MNCRCVLVPPQQAVLVRSGSLLIREDSFFFFTRRYLQPKWCVLVPFLENYSVLVPFQHQIFSSNRSF